MKLGKPAADTLYISNVFTLTAVESTAKTEKTGISQSFPIKKEMEIKWGCKIVQENKSWFTLKEG